MKKITFLEDEEGSASLEASYIFNVYVVFVLMIISLAVYVYKDTNKILKSNHFVQAVYQDRDFANKSVDMSIKNDFLFGDLINKIINFENMNLKDKDIKLTKDSKIDKINEIDYNFETLKNA